jgi:AraC family transcriptional regulator
MHQGNWLTVTKLRYPTGFALSRHHHDDACIQVVLGGEFQENGWGAGDAFGPGEALFRPAGFEHANAPLPGSSTALSFRLTIPKLPEQIGDSVGRSRPARTQNPQIGSLARRIAREMAASDAFSSMVIDALCTEVVVGVLRETAKDAVISSTSRVADKAVEVIRQRITGPLSVESVAEEIGTDRFRLNRAFLKFKGCCAAEFIRAHRVEMAQRLLVQTDRPIVIIASECGFSDQSHMTRAFRITLGVTPARFRMQHRTS